MAQTMITTDLSFPYSCMMLSAYKKAVIHAMQIGILPCCPSSICCTV